MIHFLIFVGGVALGAVVTGGIICCAIARGLNW